MIGAIIQARMGSKRLPGKVYKFLGDYLIIEWVILRLKKSKLIDKIILTSTRNKVDQIFEKLKERYDITTFYGSESDLISRFYYAALNNRVQHIVRICADNPFVDPGQVDALVKFYNSNRCDYSANNQDIFNSGYADGFGAEILPFSILEKLKEQVIDARHKEHVTLFIKENYNNFNIKIMKAPSELKFPNLKFDIDNLNDFKKLDNLVKNGINIDSDASSIIKNYLKIKNNVLN